MSALQCPKCHENLDTAAKFCGACGTVLAGPEMLIGKTLGGRYKVLSKLGQGGMGTVFRAEQVSVKRKIALKVLDPQMAWDPELIRRFQAEAEVVARLSHPNIVTLFDFGQAEDGLLFIAMELADGHSLRDVVGREAPLPPARALDIIEQVIPSLIDAHAAGVIHRDLKPDNVILSDRAGRKDFARVLDFGIAKLRDEQPGANMTKAGQLLGTPGYMAPEQITGERVDARTDVYAIGCMLHELLTGHIPLEAQTPLAMIARQMNERVRPMSESYPQLGIPAPLVALVAQCLERSQAARPADMTALAAAIAGLRAGLSATTTATPPPLPAAPAGTALPPLPMPSGTPPAAAQPPPMPSPSSATPPPMPASPPPVGPGIVALKPPTPPPQVHVTPGPPRPALPPGVVPLRDLPPPAKAAPMPTWVWVVIVLGILLVIGIAIAAVKAIDEAKKHGAWSLNDRRDAASVTLVPPA